MARRSLPCWLGHLTLLGLAIVHGVGLPLRAQVRGNTPPRVVEAAARPALVSGEVLLRWRNGDELSGRLLEGPDGAVRLSAAPFAAPLDLRPGQLSGLRFAAGDGMPPGAATSDFEITLKNGDRLRGAVIAIDEKAITFACDSFSDPVAIPREVIIRLARVGKDGDAFSGLGEIEDWTSYGRDRKPTDWYTDLRGELATHQWSGNLYREISLPDRVEVQFHAQFPHGSPNLQVGLLREPTNGPMLETWENHLVLTHLTRFAPIMEMGPQTRELNLRLFWDQTSGKIEVCDPAGRTLASLSGSTSPENPDPRRRLSDPFRRGFHVLSRNPEMKLLSLEVRPWDGRPVPVIDLTQPRIRLQGESASVRAGVVSLERGGSRLKIGSQSHALDQLVEWVLSPESDRADAETVRLPASLTRIAWSSGSSLSGRFVRLGPEAIALQPEWADAPLTGASAGIREIRFPENAEPLAIGTDRLALSGLTLRGHVRLAGDDASRGTLLAWQPPGADQAVPFAEGAEVEIVRGAYGGNEGEGSSALTQARLYLETDEILSGNLLSLDADKIVFESRITGRIEVDASKVRAVDTGTSGRILGGFRDHEWEEVEAAPEEIEITDESVTMRGGSFGNPSILLGDRVKFQTEWQESYGAMTLRLFASGADANVPSTDVIIAAQGNRLFIGKLNENGAFSFSGDQIPIVNNRATIDLLTSPKNVEVLINGKSALTLKVERDKVSGNGLYFKMGGGWQGWNQAGSAIVISEFRIENSPGSVPLRLIDPRAKTHALAIPRAMREKPPTHLLIAPNGDLLRGALESADADTVKFFANGTSLEIPRLRVSSIVRLAAPEPSPGTTQAEPAKADKPDESENQIEEVEEEDVEAEETGEAAEEPPLDAAHQLILAGYDFPVTHQLVLRDGSRLRLSGKSVEQGQLSGESAILGKCLVSLEQIRRIDRTPPRPLVEAKPMDLIAFHDWQTVFTPDPVIPDPAGSPASPLVGKPASDFKLTLLDDSTFSLADHQNKVVVLDFWATWCGPCIKAMPEVMGAVGAFPPDAVTFLAVNQGETPPLITGFLEAREWQDIPVALDFNLKISKAYEVESIPHTVVIDPQGKIAWVHTGYSPDLKQKLFEAIAGILSGGPRP